MSRILLSTYQRSMRADCEKCGPNWPCIEHCPNPLSPYAQVIVARCKAEERTATDAERIFLYAELADLLCDAWEALR